jgi:hypothetical protein
MIARRRLNTGEVPVNGERCWRWWRNLTRRTNSLLYHPAGRSLRVPENTGEIAMKMKVIGAAAIAFGLCGAVGAFAGDGNKEAGADDKFAKMDTNADGKITASEHAAGGRTKFQSLDTNKDGSVTATEMDAAHAGKTEGMKMSSADKIKKMDTNGDGKLSASEHEAGSTDMFAKSDANKDGSLTADEMKAAHQKHMADRK